MQRTGKMKFGWQRHASCGAEPYGTFDTRGTSARRVPRPPSTPPPNNQLQSGAQRCPFIPLRQMLPQRVPKPSVVPPQHNHDIDFQHALAPRVVRPPLSLLSMHNQSIVPKPPSIPPPQLLQSGVPRSSFSSSQRVLPPCFKMSPLPMPPHNQNISLESKLSLIHI